MKNRGREGEERWNEAGVLNGCYVLFFCKRG